MAGRERVRSKGVREGTGLKVILVLFRMLEGIGGRRVTVSVGMSQGQ